MSSRPLPFPDASDGRIEALIRAGRSFRATLPTVDLQHTLPGSPTRGLAWHERWVWVFNAPYENACDLSDEVFARLWLRLWFDPQHRVTAHERDALADLRWIPDVLSNASPMMARACGIGLKVFAVSPVDRWIQVVHTRAPLGLGVLASGVIRLLACWRPLVHRGLVDHRTMTVLLTDRVRVLSRRVSHPTQTESALSIVRALVALALVHVVGSVDGAAKGASQPKIQALLTILNHYVHDDGGCVCRCPSSSAILLSELLVLVEAMWLTGYELAAQMNAIGDRLQDACAFFVLPDGCGPVFQGDRESDPSTWDVLRKRSTVQDVLPHTGYARLRWHQFYCLMDMGTHGVDRARRHASPLAIEVGYGRQRLLTSCGPAPDLADSASSASCDQEVSGDPKWYAAMRSTAAHSTLSIQETNAFEVFDHNDHEQAQGTRDPLLRWQRQEKRSIVAEHDGYVDLFGLRHRRSLRMELDPLAVHGTDVLVAPEGAALRSVVPVQFFIRFHLHPSLHAHLLTDEHAVLLVAKRKPGWRAPPFVLRCTDASVTLIPSVYSGRGRVEPTMQVVLTGLADRSPARVHWSLERLVGRVS